MEAIVISEYGGPEKLVIRDLPTPSPQSGDVLVRVRAFGINRAETYMRRGAWPEIAPVSGIECVGEIELDPSGALAPGTKVAAVMGGMGRTRNGSYARRPPLWTSAPSRSRRPERSDSPMGGCATSPWSHPL